MREFGARLRALGGSDFVRHGLLVFVATTLINVFGYAYHFAISRRVGVEQYGVLSALNSLLMLSVVLSQIGATVVVKYAAEFRATGDTPRIAQLVVRLATYGAGAVAVAILAGVLAAPALAAYLNISSVFAMTLTMVIIGITLMTPALRGVSQGVEDFVSYSVSIILESLFKLLLGVGFVYAGFGVVGAIAGWACGSAISLLYTTAVLLMRYRTVARAPLYVDVRRLAKTMAGVSLATLVLASMSNADVLVVKHYADATTAGLYGALALAGKILFFLVAFVPAVVLPKATRKALGGESSFGVLVQAVAVIVAMSAVGLVVLYYAPVLVVTTLAGAPFAPAAPYLFSYGFAMVLLAALNVVATYKMGIHRFDFVGPMAACAVGEIVGLSFFHASLREVIAVLIVGNGVALAASTYKINAPVLAPRTVTASDALA